MNPLKISLVTLMVCIALMTSSCGTGTTGNDEAGARADKMLAQMTLDEKIGQMSQLDIGYFRDAEQLKKSHQGWQVWLAPEFSRG